jgi:hypothetical protein
MSCNQPNSCVRVGYDTGQDVVHGSQSNRGSVSSSQASGRRSACARVGHGLTARATGDAKTGGIGERRAERGPPPSARPRPSPTGSSVRHAGALPRAPRQRQTLRGPDEPMHQDQQYSTHTLVSRGYVVLRPRPVAFSGPTLRQLEGHERLGKCRADDGVDPVRIERSGRLRPAAACSLVEVGFGVRGCPAAIPCGEAIAAPGRPTPSTHWRSPKRTPAHPTQIRRPRSSDRGR